MEIFDTGHHDGVSITTATTVDVVDTSIGNSPMGGTATQRGKETTRPRGSFPNLLFLVGSCHFV